MSSFKTIRNHREYLRAPGFILGQWRQGQKGEFAGRGFGVTVINSSGVDIAADKLVAIDVTMDTVTNIPKIVLASNATAGHNEIYVTSSVIHNGKTGIVFSQGLSAKTLNTNGISAGAQVFLDVVAGGFTGTVPQGVNSRVIPVGYVITSSSTVGQILWDIQAAELLNNNALVATGQISSANITGTFSHAAGFVMVPAPGAGKALVLENCVASYVFGVAAYTGGAGNNSVNWGASGAAITGVVTGANFAIAASSKPVQFVPLATVGFALVPNASLNLVTTAAYTQPGTAVGVINYAVTYQVVTL
jgi:hypothetical protein